MRVNWFLVGMGLFVLFYPIIAFLSLLIRPSTVSMPVWLMALNLAFGWSVLVWQAHNERRDRQPAHRRVTRLARKYYLDAAKWALVVFAVGVGARILLGRPTWPEIVGYSCGMGISILASDLLLTGAGLQTERLKRKR